jgi:hypothetical protein
MELDALVTMTVGELVDYVAASLASAEGTSPAS